MEAATPGQPGDEVDHEVDHGQAPAEADPTQAATPGQEAATPGQPGDEVNRAEAAAEETDPTEATTPDEVVEPEGGPASPVRGESSLDAESQAAADTFAERPEVFVGTAFAGGLALALAPRFLGPSE